MQQRIASQKLALASVSPKESLQNVPCSIAPEDILANTTCRPEGYPTGRPSRIGGVVRKSVAWALQLCHGRTQQQPVEHFSHA